MKVAPYEKESHSVWSPSISAFHQLELVRLRPLLPGQRVGGHCERAGLTKSTSFPMAVRKGMGGELGPLKEDCSNKISVQDREKREEGGAGAGAGGRAERLGKRH